MAGASHLPNMAGAPHLPNMAGATRRDRPVPLLGVQQVPVRQEAGYATSGVATRTAEVIIVVFIRACLLINQRMFAC